MNTSNIQNFILQKYYNYLILIVLLNEEFHILTICSIFSDNTIIYHHIQDSTMYLLINIISYELTYLYFMKVGFYFV